MIAEAMTREELCEAFHTSRMTLNRWEREGCPVEEILGWPKADAVSYLREWQSKNKRPRYNAATEPNENGTPQERLLAAQTRNQNAAADRKELENEVRRGELVEREEIVSEFADFLSQAKPLLEALVDDIATETADDLRVKHRQLAKNAVDQFFKKLSAWKPPRCDS